MAVDYTGNKGSGSVSPSANNIIDNDIVNRGVKVPHDYSTDPLFCALMQALVINHGITRVVPSPVTEQRIKHDILGLVVIVDNIRKVLNARD
jgi:hypothetical protein